MGLPAEHCGPLYPATCLYTENAGIFVSLAWISHVHGASFMHAVSYVLSMFLMVHSRTLYVPETREPFSRAKQGVHTRTPAPRHDHELCAHLGA